jgi:hypothetical protein
VVPVSECLTPRWDPRRRWDKERKIFSFRMKQMETNVDALETVDIDVFLNDSNLYNEIIIIQFLRWCSLAALQGTDAPPSSLAYTPRNTTHKSHRQEKHPYPIYPAPTCTVLHSLPQTFVCPSSQPHRRLSSRPAVPSAHCHSSIPNRHDINSRMSAALS